jgi:hypothetical protein
MAVLDIWVFTFIIRMDSMQLKKTVILISAFYSGALLAAQPSMNVEEKLAQLEAQIQELKQQQAARRRLRQPLWCSRKSR